MKKSGNKEFFGTLPCQCCYDDDCCPPTSPTHALPTRLVDGGDSHTPQAPPYTQLARKNPAKKLTSSSCMSLPAVSGRSLLTDTLATLRCSRSQAYPLWAFGGGGGVHNNQVTLFSAVQGRISSLPILLFGFHALQFVSFITFFVLSYNQ